MNKLIFTMYNRGLIWNAIRGMFSWLDSMAYTLFGWVMQLVFDIAQVSTSDAFSTFYTGIQSRIYVIITIYMLFKITISMLSYLVNPDSINDKERGVGKMSTRVIVALAMLIFFPTGFHFLNTVQPHIIEALPRIILQKNVNSGDNLGQSLSTMGSDIAFSTYNGVFFNTNRENLPEGVHTVSQATDYINEPVDGDNNSYKYEYIPIVGMITAIVMTLIILGYCIDIAVRVFKLIILQLIAPIPIISYIDPKSSKDGAFSKWIKMVISVWTELFIKLGCIYFIFLVIYELFQSNVIGNLTSELFGNSGVRGGLVILALIIGLLFFAKDAPKFICDAMGIKRNENGKLFGGLSKVMSAGALGLGALGSAIASGRASYLADEANGKDHNVLRGMKNVGAGLFGAASGLGAGVSAAVNAKDHNTKAVMDALAKRNSGVLAAGAAGSTLLGRAGSSLSGLVGGETAANRGKRNIAALEAQKSSLETIKSRVSGEMVKQDWTQAFLLDKDGNALMTDVAGEGVTGSINYKDFMARKNAAAAAGEKSFVIMTSDGAQEISMADAERYQGLIQKGNEEDYLIRGASQDKILAANIGEAEALGLHVTNRDSVNGAIDNLSIEIATAKRENAKKEQNDRFSGSGGKS